MVVAYCFIGTSCGKLPQRRELRALLCGFNLEKCGPPGKEGEVAVASSDNRDARDAVAYEEVWPMHECACPLEVLFCAAQKGRSLGRERSVVLCAK